MRTPASIAGHPLHPMLVTLPIGLFIFSLASDLISFYVENPEAWTTVAFYTMGGGLVGALIAAVPGLIDLLSLRNHHLQKIAITHMSLNLSVVALFAFNFWLRFNGAGNQGTPFWLSLVAVATLAVSGWLGAEMVHKHGVGVQVEIDAAELEEGAAHGASSRQSGPVRH